MGADLLIWTLAIPRSEVPDWDAGRKWVRTEQERCAEVATAEGIPIGEVILTSHGEYTADELLEAIDYAEIAFNHDSRELCWFLFGEWELFQTGGLSWGDDPTNLSPAFQKLQDEGELLKAIGFKWPASKESKKDDVS